MMSSTDEFPVSEYRITGNIIYTAQIPYDKSGKLVSGGIREQTIQVLENLQSTMEKVASRLDHVDHILIYLIDKNDFEGMNEVYRAMLAKPFPSRATVVVKELLVTGM